MPAVLSMPRRRLRSKTWLGFEIVDVDPSDCGTPAQGPTAKLCYITAEQLEQEDGTSSRKVYLVTFPALSRAGDGDTLTSGLVCPSTWQHGHIARVLLHTTIVRTNKVNTTTLRIQGSKLS